MNIKRFGRRILATALSVMTAATMLCVGITANAAQTRYLVDTTKKASLTLHKYEMADTSLATRKATGTAQDAQYIPKGAKPLAGVTFTVYQVSNLDRYFTSEGVTLPKVGDIDKTQAIATYSKTTGTDGIAKFTDLPLGIYYVEETDGPAQITKKIAPFVLSLPMTDVSGKQWLYNVDSYPKNQTAYGGLTLEKIDSKTNAALKGTEFTLYSSTDGKTYKEYKTGIVTGTNGTARISALPSNTYYKFVETKASDDSYILDSTVGYEFFVDGTGDVLVDNKVVENKTITVGNDTVTIHKYVLDGEKGAEGIDNTANYGDTVHWKIKTSIPTNVEKLSTYTIVDTMSTGLEYSGAELWVDDKTQLVKDTDYTVSQDGLNVTFTISPEKLKSGAEVEVYFDTLLTDSAPLATDIPNTSKIIYTNNVGTDSTYTKNSETPNVHTGGYAFVKTDGDKPLQGAQFAIYATEKDAKEGDTPIYVEKSDKNGLVQFKGLKYGSFSADEAGKDKNGTANGSTDYWICEVAAPKGYVLLTSPIKVTVNNRSHIAANNTAIINDLIPELPITGAIGTVALFTLSGILIASGVILLTTRRKKKNNG